MKRIEFKYHPNLYSDEILIHEEGVCNCCGRKVPEYIGMAYSPEDTDCICLSCIHDGSAAEKLNAEFVQFAEDVSDPEKRDELFKRTPGYMSWQGENWLACCDDYCAYLGRKRRNHRQHGCEWKYAGDTSMDSAIRRLNCGTLSSGA